MGRNSKASLLRLWVTWSHPYKMAALLSRILWLCICTIRGSEQFIYDHGPDAQSWNRYRSRNQKWHICWLWWRTNEDLNFKLKQKLMPVANFLSFKNSNRDNLNVNNGGQQYHNLYSIQMISYRSSHWLSSSMFTHSPHTVSFNNILLTMLISNTNTPAAGGQILRKVLGLKRKIIRQKLSSKSRETWQSQLSRDLWGRFMWLQSGESVIVPVFCSLARRYLL